MKVTVLLRNDHETLKSLFNKFKMPGGPRSQDQTKQQFKEIRRELLIHSQMELEVFYPALAATSSARAAELVSVAEPQHRALEQLLEELNSMNTSDKTFESKMDKLMEVVGQHIEMEEEDIFDEARKSLPESRLEELGLEMEDRRKILSDLAA